MRPWRARGRVDAVVDGAGLGPKGSLLQLADADSQSGKGQPTHVREELLDDRRLQDRSEDVDPPGTGRS